MRKLYARVETFEGDPKRPGHAIKPPHYEEGYEGMIKDKVIDQIEECIVVDELAARPPPPPGRPEDAIFAELGVEEVGLRSCIQCAAAAAHALCVLHLGVGRRIRAHGRAII